MFDVPTQYAVNKKIPIKNFITSDLKPVDRKKIRENIKKVVLTDQIAGEEILSTLNETYNYQVIQFFDFEIVDIKKVGFIATIYQEMIKPPCIIRFFTPENEVYSFALKRLNQNDKTQIIVTDSFTSDIFSNNFSITQKDIFHNTICYPAVVNRLNKYSLYVEIFVKSYIITHEKLYAKGIDFLSKPLWYDTAKVMDFYTHLSTLVTKKNELTKVTTHAEKVQLNKEIKTILSTLDTI